MKEVWNVATDKPEPVIIREKLTRKILRPLMANFTCMSEALHELVDNTFDEFDGIHGGTHLKVSIEIRKNTIVIENLGGKGMGAQELKDWLEWGGTRKTGGIREYGQGGKAAMGYLGTAWTVHTKRFDEPWLWEMREDKWDDFTSNEKTYKAIASRSDRKLNGLGYCRFEIRSLNKQRQEINRLKTKLANVYRTYLEDGKTTITVNSESVPPLALPLYEGFEIQQVRARSPQGCSIKGWIGRLRRDSRVRGGPKIVGGMRLLRKGRLICDGEYFGHPDFRHKASLGMLIGEVELSKVPVLPNKTAFDTDSKQWAEVQIVMYDVLKPHIEALLKQSEDETVTREERKRVAQVRMWMIDAIKLLGEQSDLQDWFGLDQGRKKPERSPSKKVDPEANPEMLQENKRKDYQPRTPPQEGSIGRLRRLGIIPEIALRPLEPGFRSAWVEEEGKRLLLINKSYCLYDERRGDDLYLAETSALQLEKPQGDERLTMEEYISRVDSLMRAFCQVYNSAQ
jgi:hypothetical protein